MSALQNRRLQGGSAAVVGGGEQMRCDRYLDLSQSCINDTPLYTQISPTYLLGAVGGKIE